MAFKVVSHTPTINEEGIDRNGSIEIIFSNTIIASSVEPYKLSINDSSDFTTVPGEYEVSGNKVIFTPTINMLPNNKYTVFVHGKPNSILSIANEQLLETYSFEFTTGTTVSSSTPVSLATPMLLEGSYNYDDDALTLWFNTCIESTSISGLLAFSVYEGRESAVLNTPTWSGACREVVIPIPLDVATSIELMSSVSTELELSFPTGVFFYQSNSNLITSYFPLKYVGNVSGTVSGVSSGVLPDIPFSGFYVYTTYPQNQQPNVPTGILGIDITFTADIVGLPNNLSGYVVITEKDVLE